MLLEIQQAGGSTRSQVRSLMLAIFAQPPEQRALIRLASQEMPQLSQEARARFGLVYYTKFIAQVEAILRNGIASGIARPGHSCDHLALARDDVPVLLPGARARTGHARCCH
ncbi:hypothetical protein [Candidatus Amarolinea dominans]|uniref:hypothetical protein n=1 Tax=Candidatus Amarolinea dominans TaxID=3140696 RepID=UPI0031CC4D0A